MGWWKNAQGDVIGDDPADAVSSDLQELAGVLGRRLTLPELLGYVHVVLAAKSRDLLSAESTVPPLVAELEVFGDGEPVVETVAMAPAHDPAIRQRVDAMCARVSGFYEAILERRPTLAEMLASICFPLGHGLIEISRDTDVTAIRVTTR